MWRFRTSMITACQGKTHVSYTPRRSFLKHHRGAGSGPSIYPNRSVSVRPTQQRDQTSICGNSAGPSAKIEFGTTGRPRNKGYVPSEDWVFLGQSIMARTGRRIAEQIVVRTGSVAGWQQFPAPPCTLFSVSVVGCTRG